MKSEAACTSSQEKVCVSPFSFSTLNAIPAFPTAKTRSLTFPTSCPLAFITCIETNASLVNGLSVFSIFDSLCF